MKPSTVAVLAASLVACAHPGSTSPKRADLLYVSNEGSGDISVIDVHSDEVVAKISCGNRPRGLRLSPDGRWLYVALSGSPTPPVDPARDRSPRRRTGDAIGVIDVDRRVVAWVLPSGDDPVNLDLSPDGKFLYVSNEETATASVVDVSAGRILASARVGEEPAGVAARPDGEVIYVTSRRESKVTVLGAQGKVLASFPTGPHPRNVVFSPDGVLAFVSAEEGGSVTVVDARRHTPLATLRIDAPGAKPTGLAVSRDGTRLYVSNGQGATVSAIDIAAQKVVATFSSGGGRSGGIAVTRDGKKLYVANAGSDEVAVLDAFSGGTGKRIAVGSRPWAVALTR